MPTVAELIKDHALRLYQNTGWDKRETAAQLDVSVCLLQRWLLGWGVVTPRGEADTPTAATVFTTGTAAKVMRCSQQVVIREFDRGAFHGYRIPGSKFRRIPRADLIAYCRSHNLQHALATLGESDGTGQTGDGQDRTTCGVGGNEAGGVGGATEAERVGGDRGVPCGL